MVEMDIAEIEVAVVVLILQGLGSVQVKQMQIRDEQALKSQIQE